MEAKERRFEDLPEMGDRARKETEDFLNRWIHDSTKGWRARPAFIGRYKERLSAPVTVCLG